MKNMEALRFKPVAFWRLGDTAPFLDYSGYNRTASLIGTEAHGLAVSAGNAFSQKISSTRYITFQSPVFAQNKERQAFSISVAAYPIGSGTEQRLVSHGGSLDGITIAGTIVSFSTKYVNTGEARCTHDIGVSRRIDIVAVHTNTKNSLYVNGELVDEVEISEVQQADIYDVTDDDFYCGGATSSQSAMVNDIAFFPHALHTEDVKAIYDANTRRAAGDVPKMFSGDDVFLSSVVRDAPIATGWNSEEDWEAGQHELTTVDDGQLVAQMDTGLTLASQWLDSVDLYVGETPIALESVSMFWYGEGETVEVSLDGITWTPVERGSNIPIISPGFNPVDQELYVRVSFAAGLEYAYIDYLQVRGYTSTTVEQDNRTITYTSPIVVLDEYHPLEMRDDWGVNIESGGSISIGPDLITDTPVPVETVEVWVKKNTTALTHNLTPDATYVNGISGGSADNNEWHVVHYTVAAGVSGTITLSGDVQIGKVAFYDSVLTQSDIDGIVANYTGIQSELHDGDGTIALSEPAEPALIYAHDWEIAAS